MVVSADAVPFLGFSPAIARLIELALEEDLGRGDVTTEAIGESRSGVGLVMARQALVVCGLPVAEWVVQRGDPRLTLSRVVDEGATVNAGACLARLQGPVQGILRLERTLLNFLQRLSGVATRTSRFVEAAAGTRAQIADTRKTLPGWRTLDKYAVRVGGGVNHRADLGSGILIKDNHIVACGGVSEAVRRAKARAPHPLRIEVEVESLEAARQALSAGAEVLLLDNFDPGQVKQLLEALGEQALLEVSGGVTLENVRAFAEAGARLISVGGLTHSAPAVDLSLDLEVQ